MPLTVAWDAKQYEQFAAQRERPFNDLLAAIATRNYRFIVDAGCGTGRTTARLAQQFAGAQVLGVDQSATMLAAARGADISFEQADLTSWTPPQAPDLLISNAVLHWLPNPEATLDRLASWVAPGGVLAFQVPANHNQPSHQIVARAATQPEWRERLANIPRGDHVLDLHRYAQLLSSWGFEVDAWQTTYIHMLGGRDPVLEWLKGTTLRPHMEALGDDSPAFLQALRDPLRSAYPGDAVTPFAFTRRFVVATRANSH